MQIKKHKIFSQKLSLLAPVFAFFFSIASIFALILLTSNNSTFAAPGAGGTPTTVSFALDAMSVDFHFTPAELSASTFKQDAINASISTNNSTGFNFYVSSIDEDTNLNHTDSSITTKIASITSPQVESNFTSKSWGYSADGVNFKPTPKASAPDTVLTTTNTIGQRARVDFGVKASPDLNSGTYSKQVLFTATTNYVPKEAIFLPGSQFNTIASTVAGGDMDNFKRSSHPPANPASTTIVSTTDSYVPIYLWYDTTDKTLYWWSEADVAYMNEDASNMFSEIVIAKPIKTVDTRGINTSKTKNMNNIFGSKKWNVIDKLIISDFDTRNVEDMGNMFKGLAVENGDFTTILNSPGFNTSKVKNMSGMFSGTNARNLDLSRFDTRNVEDMSFMFGRTMYLDSLNLTGFDTSKVRKMSGLFSHTKLSDFSFLSALNTSNVTNMSYIFSSIDHNQPFNFPNINTSNVTDMRGMFMYSNFTQINISNLDTSRTTNMSQMFAHMKKLTNLDLSNFITNDVEDMSEMFSETVNLTTLDLSNFRTGNVKNMSFMFGKKYYGGGCYPFGDEERKMTSLNLAHWDTSNVENMSGMFSGLNKITHLDLGNFNTSKVKDMSIMFCNTKNLTSLNLDSFDTRNVTNMSHMFYSTMVNPPNGILDISSFNTEKLVYADMMFYYSNFKTIYVSNNFTTASVLDDQRFFVENPYLVGGNGTSFSPSNPIIKTYARIDAPGTPGYFTLKP